MADETKTGPTIEGLQAEVTRLTNENRGLAADLKEANGEARDRRIELRGVKEQLTAATTERDQFRAAAQADPEGVKAQLATATGELRGMKHQKAFDRVAASKGVTGEKQLADLFVLSGYKAEKDDIDEKAIGDCITTALEGRDWLRTPPASGDAAGDKGKSTTGATNAAGAANGGAGAHGARATIGAGPGGDRGTSSTTDTSTRAGRIPGRL